MEKKRLGDLLLEKHMISKEDLNRALEIQKRRRDKLGTILIDEGILDEESILKTLESQLGIPRIDFSTVYLQDSAVKSISYILGKKHCVVPIYYKDEYTLVVAMNDPLDIIALDDLRLYTGKEIQPVIAGRNEIENILARYFDNEVARKAVLELREDSAMSNPDDNRIAAEVNNAPIVRLVNSIIEQGVRNQASDIHIEPFVDRIRVRMRIDGVLNEIMKVDIHTHNAIVSRIKVMSDLNIAEKRLPQDGSIVYKIDGRDVDVRVSILPTVFGEKIVLRILDSTQLILDKEDLGFTSNELAIVENMLETSHGIILVTGPTGSGKTSTLYTLLRSLNEESRNIITVEDPIEYKLDGINQVQVNQKIGLTFVNALRSILRQDPDIIMIGEIRDVETAKIAMRASITGHLVLSTVHTNDAVSAISRLLDMGIPSYLVSAALTGIISQRLVRKVCNRCKTTYEASNYEKKLLGIPDCEPLFLYKGQGCAVCNNTGYKGRVAVHEVLKISRQHRDMILHQSGTEEIRDISIKDGMVTLNKNAVILAKKGITTLEEAVKVTFSDVD